MLGEDFRNLADADGNAGTDRDGRLGSLHQRTLILEPTKKGPEATLSHVAPGPVAGIAVL
jgi:hypothetical protein